MKFLSKSKGLITGIINQNSIAWGIAKMAQEYGAELAITYYDKEKLKDRVLSLSKELNGVLIYPCDLSNEESIKNLFEAIKKEWGTLDFIVHSVAFSDKDELKGRYLDTSLSNFLNTMNISCYSLVSLLKHAEILMEKNGGSVLALTYYGANKVIKNYNVMGVAKAALESSVKYLASDLGSKNIRVNAISAGPIKTLSASGISDFRDMIKIHEQMSPLRRNITQQDIAKSSMYFLSNLSSGVTGEIHYVDCGYNIMGCPPNSLII